MTGPADGQRDWEEAYRQGRHRKDRFTTLSFEDVPALGSPPDAEPGGSIGYPGTFPYTRGIHPSGYRGKLWTMRQFAGFASAEQTNERFHYLLSQGQDGLSVAFDMPTLMGLDADDERSLGEVGHCGVSISSSEDMVDLFDGIPLGDVSVSMTINGPAEVLF
ncbi:MAG: methylmalonyl-CoA mutase family protein, partial [Acidimicrobiia bacterium]